MKKKQTQANRYNLQYHNPSTHSGSTENTNEESPSPPIKATTLFLLSLKILKVTFCRAHLKMALFGSSFVVSPENCSLLLVNRWLFIIAIAANLVTEGGGVFLILFFFFFFQLPPTVRHCSWKAVSILLRMHKPKKVLHSQYCQGTKQLCINSHSPGRQLTQFELLRPPQLRGGRVGECKQHMCMVQMLPFMVCHLSRNPSSSEISAETPAETVWARAQIKHFGSR